MNVALPVETLLELLSSGMTTEEILADYQDLEREDILAVLAFAARLSQVKRLEPTTAELIERAVAAKLDGLDINNLPERPSGDIGQITQAGLQAYVWTVNSAERAAWHQAEGIHGITTDVPARLMATLK